MKPTTKSNRANTYHKDGTVSYWDVFTQQWERRKASRISGQLLGQFNDFEKRRIAQHAYTHDA